MAEMLLNHSVFIKDMNDFAVVNKVYGKSVHRARIPPKVDAQAGEFFGHHKPARTCVEAS